MIGPRYGAAAVGHAGDAVAHVILFVLDDAVDRIGDLCFIAVGIVFVGESDLPISL
ncbi:hypothetical protein [Neobacillus dielmonensis]|uniref:hypothetical protein n=1 Tax=Neobacillus dielmonensis TaxID=1347369 RepID=UPI0038739427